MDGGGAQRNEVGLVRPRYTVGTVTGWPITQATVESGRSVRSKPSTIAYVYDSAYCYRPVAVFLRRARGRNLEAAQALADQLNQEEAERG